MNLIDLAAAARGDWARCFEPTVCWPVFGRRYPPPAIAHCQCDLRRLRRGRVDHAVQGQMREGERTG